MVVIWVPDSTMMEIGVSPAKMVIFGEHGGLIMCL